MAGGEGQEAWPKPCSHFLFNRFRNTTGNWTSKDTFY